jgi:hypothetical protein
VFTLHGLGAGGGHAAAASLSVCRSPSMTAILNSP